MKLGKGDSFAVVPLDVAFTPKGGCPLKPRGTASEQPASSTVAFTPKGGCPLKLQYIFVHTAADPRVAFTPKGGCPLKL